MEEIKTVKEHLNDLKKILLRIVIIAGIVFFLGFAISEKIIIYLINYFELELFSLAPLEFVKTQLIISLYLTIAFTLPFILVQIYNFSKPMTTKKTQKKSVFYFFYSLSLAIIGFLFGVFLFSRFSLDFFATLPEQVSPLWGIYSSISFIMLSGFAFAITTQIIIIIPVLVKTGLINLKTIKKSRGIVIILALAISAIVTSPDPITQVLMSVPMYVCFEAGIIISSFQKKEKQNEPNEEKEKIKTKEK